MLLVLAGARWLKAEPAFSDTQAAPPNYVRLALTSRVYDMVTETPLQSPII